MTEALKFSAAIVAAQKAMPSLHKDSEAEVQTKTGGKYKYSYLSLESLLEQVLPVLNEHGLALLQFPEIADGKPVLTTELRHESGDGIRSTMLLPVAPDAGAQTLGSAITYARRYAILAVLALAPDEDDDGNAAMGRQRQTTSQTRTDVDVSGTTRDVPQPADGPSRAQHARLAVLLKELEEKHPKAEGQQPYVDDARSYIKAKFGKHSRSQLSRTEMQDLIDEVEGWAEAAGLPFSERVPA